MTREEQIARDAHRLYDAIVNVVAYGSMFSPEAIVQVLGWLEDMIEQSTNELEHDLEVSIRTYLLACKREIEG